VGGFVSVSAHGSGGGIGPVDTFVEGIGVVYPRDVDSATPLSNSNPFDVTLVGMGGLGVLTDVTFRAVERYKIKEVTRTVSRKEAVGLLRGGIVHRFKHCR